jgi:hypothetical protein
MNVQTVQATGLDLADNAGDETATEAEDGSRAVSGARSVGRGVAKAVGGRAVPHTAHADSEGSLKLVHASQDHSLKAKACASGGGGGRVIRIGVISFAAMRRVGPPPPDAPKAPTESWRGVAPRGGNGGGVAYEDGP